MPRGLVVSPVTCTGFIWAQVTPSRILDLLLRGNLDPIRQARVPCLLEAGRSSGHFKERKEERTAQVRQGRPTFREGSA